MYSRVLTCCCALAAFAIPASSALADGGPIMPLSDVQAGMDCTGESVIQGTAISSFNVHVINTVYVPGEGPRILVRASGPAVDNTGIASGFSGSPVYCQDSQGTSRNVGAISQGVGDFGNFVALVTPIEQMLGEPVSPPPAAPRFSARDARDLLGPLTVGGLSPGMLNLLQAAGRRVGRVILAAPGGQSETNFPVVQLVPGASVGVSYSTGSIPIGAVGTVTYVNGQNVYAFGHELDGAGRRSLVLQDAFVDGVISNPILGSYKYAAPGHVVGTLTSDTPNAVIGRLGQAPPLVPVDVTVQDLDTGRTLLLASWVADESDIGLPLGNSLVDLVAPLEAGQAATAIFNGPPANESGGMCVTVRIRESTLPLGFCNRYVASGPPGDGTLGPPALASAVTADLSTGFGLLEQVQFATLHVTSVTAQISAQRGLSEAAIVSAQAPRRVRPGELVSVRLVVRGFRAGLRTVTFKWRIPRGARHTFNASLRGPASPLPAITAPSPPAGLSMSLAGPGSSSFGPQLPPPDTITSLRKAFAGIAMYDGLTIAASGSKPEQIYRDPKLLITGSTNLTFHVVTGRRARHGRRR
jgi:hypothetical protein